MRRQLGGAGGAAGVEITGDIVRVELPAAFQPVGRASGDQLVEVQHAFGQRPALRLEGAALRLGQQVGHVHADHRLEAGKLAAQRLDLGPQVGAGEGRQGHQQLGIGGLDQLGDMLGFQQRIDRVDDPGRLAAPDGEVGLRQVGQQERHRLARAQAEAVKGVGGLGDLAQQLLVIEAIDGFVAATLEDKGQRRRLRLRRGRAADQLVGAGWQVAFGQRSGFDLLDIG
ncbi:hypothetical protein D3C80_1430120 [compost metagenome]